MRRKKYNQGGFTRGPSHKDGGIPMIVKSTGQKVELEGGEGIINKKSMSDNKKYKVEGTPRQIASAINEIDGNGVRFDEGATLTTLEKGGNIYDISISDKYSKSRNKYEMFADKGPGREKVGEAKIKQNYDYPNMIEIENISIDEPYSHPTTYTHFTKAIINKSKNNGAIINIKCINDECYEELVSIGDVSHNCENLIIRK
jgi:hypothetical protein